MARASSFLHCTSFQTLVVKMRVQETRLLSLKEHLREAGSAGQKELLGVRDGKCLAHDRKTSGIGHATRKCGCIK